MGKFEFSGFVEFSEFIELIEFVGLPNWGLLGFRL